MLKEEFEAYGADYQVTMARFVNNEALYLRFLDMLFEDKSLQNLGGALESGDTAAAFAAAHTLKGVVGNMGLTPLFQAVCAIVEPLRAGKSCEEVSALYDTVCEEFKKADLFRSKVKGGGV